MLDRPLSVAQAQNLLIGRLAAAGIANAPLDSRLLLMHAVGLTHEALIAEPHRLLSVAEAERLEAMARRRLGHEPVSRIVGEREFYGRSFLIGPAVLDPRPETETLIDVVLAHARTLATPPAMLDLGTGSGAILVTLLAELPQAWGMGTDRDEAALRIARRNALRYGVTDRARLVVADWCRGIAGRFDVIVSNPPYIPSGDITGLEPEVRDFDPRPALDGGFDGLDAFRTIAGNALPLLRPGGLVAVEIGAGQAPAVTAIFVRQGWQANPAAASAADLSGRVRVLCFTAAAAVAGKKKVGNLPMKG